MIETILIKEQIFVGRNRIENVQLFYDSNFAHFVNLSEVSIVTECKVVTQIEYFFFFAN